MVKKKILLVDDSSTVRLMERMILSDPSYELTEAEDGEAGVESALRLAPDLILMDVMMPRLDGFAAVARLREHAATRDTPIIMVTTRSEAEQVENGYLSGCSDYVTKPIHSEELLAKVRDLLER